MKNILMIATILISTLTQAGEQIPLKSAMMCFVTLQESRHGNDAAYDSYFTDSAESSSVSLHQPINTRPHLLRGEKGNRFQLRSRFSMHNPSKEASVELFKATGEHHNRDKDEKLLEIKVTGSAKNIEMISDKDVASYFKSATLICIATP